MEAIAKLRNVPTSTRKMRLIADLIRGKGVDLALNTLKFDSKIGSKRMEKLLLSAIANWQEKNKDSKIEDSDLFIKEIFVDGGKVIKRLRPAPQGRAHRIRKSTDKRWANWYPLSLSMTTKQIVKTFWKTQAFDLQVKTGFGNCDGCFLKSEATLAALWREHPNRAQWWADMEIKKGATFHKNRTYKELGDFVSRQGDWIFDAKEFFCQQDDGECVI